jgi:hypothetical protein
VTLKNANANNDENPIALYPAINLFYAFERRIKGTGSDQRRMISHQFGFKCPIVVIARQIACGEYANDNGKNQQENSCTLHFSSVNSVLVCS